MILIGLAGNKRSGKDTFYNYVKHNINQDVISFSFAKPVKDICNILFSLSDEQLYGHEKEVVDKRYGLSARTMMQRLGTELFRDKFSDVFPELNYGSKVWVKVLENKLKKYVNTDQVIFVTDVRFKDEMDLITKYNGINIKIVREGKKSTDTHSSENDLNDKTFDYTIENTTLNNYYKKIEELYNKLI
jgi:hypothetical protein